MTSQETFTCSKSTRETVKVYVVLMSLFFTIATLNRKMFFWIASSDYETMFIYLLFFQIIKRCCQVHVEATSAFEIISIGMFQKEAIFCYF